MGTAVYGQTPSAEQVQRFLERSIRRGRVKPRYFVTDKGTQFACRSFKDWCKRRDIRPRYGAIGQPASIAIVERFIRSMKVEGVRCLLVPLSLVAMRREIEIYVNWYNAHRPHSALAGKTPREVFVGRSRRPKRLEPRSRWPRGPGRRSRGCDRFRLSIEYSEGRRHLPVIELRRAA